MKKIWAFILALLIFIILYIPSIYFFINLSEKGLVALDHLFILAFYLVNIFNIAQRFYNYLYNHGGRNV